jgi:ribonuclease R
MGNSGLKKLEDIGTHISSTERRAADAEREVMSKYIAQVMENHTGEVFEARISSVQSFGFFVSISPYGVDGLVHIRTLDPRDYFIHDPKRHLLRGERSKKTYALGDQVLVVLLQADTLTGKLTFGLHQEIEVVPFSPPTVKKKKKLKKERFQSR